MSYYFTVRDSGEGIIYLLPKGFTFYSNTDHSFHTYMLFSRARDVLLYAPGELEAVVVVLQCWLHSSVRRFRTVSSLARRVLVPTAACGLWKILHELLRALGSRLFQHRFAACSALFFAAVVSCR